MSEDKRFSIVSLGHCPLISPPGEKRQGEKPLPVLGYLQITNQRKNTLHRSGRKH